MTKPKSTTAERSANLQRMEHTRPKSTPKNAGETLALMTRHLFLPTLIAVALDLTIAALVYTGHEEAATLVRVGRTVWLRWRSGRRDE